MVHAQTALELRVELRGRGCRWRCKDQDPDLLGWLAAKEETDRGLGLQIVDQVAKVWGVRQDEAGGKIVWCTLELPPPEAEVAGADEDPTQAMGLPGSGLVESKLITPVPRAGLLPRASLQPLLEAGLQAKLCLVDAPAGFGKTTLLAQWQAAAGAGGWPGCRWTRATTTPRASGSMSVEALRTRRAGRRGCGALGGPGSARATDLNRVVLPELLNELASGGAPLVLVLDDYHLIIKPSCHQTLELLPGPSAGRCPCGRWRRRVDPPLPLARMRARGELAELRVVDLEFTDEEAAELLNGVDGTGPGGRGRGAAGRADRGLGGRAGTWPGCRCAAGTDPSAFIAAFHGDNRHVADYLGVEVLARQPETMRTFLLRTSILERLSGPLCDAVLEAEGRRGCWPSWSAPTCSWSRWTTTASGIATIICSRSCSAWSLATASPGWCRRPAPAGRGLAPAGRQPR